MERLCTKNTFIVRLKRQEGADEKGCSRRGGLSRRGNTRRRVPFLLQVFARRESPTRRRKPDEKAPTRSFTPRDEKYSGSACGRRDKQ
jgi:hypothetical protein